MKQKRPVISAEALKQAMQAFRDRGGMIKVLPRQKDIQRNAVGQRWCNSAMGRDAN